MKILHIADAHLDTAFKNIQTQALPLLEKMKAATYKAFERLVQSAIEDQVDFVVIAGDSFNAAKPSVVAQYFFAQQLQRLVDADIQVLLIYGNHDFQEGSLLVSLPEAVHVFPSHVETLILETKLGEKVAFSGFSYDRQHVNQRMILDYPQRFDQVDFHVGILHGDLEGTQSQEGLYAPFSMSQLNSKHYDYWALGHIHKASILQENPPVVYPGNIQGLNRKETGDKGAVLAHFQKGLPVTLEQIIAHDILWARESLEVASQTPFTDLIQTIKEKLEAYKHESLTFLSLDFILTESDADYQEALSIENLRSLLNSPSLYIYKVSLKVRQNSQLISLEPGLQSQWLLLQEKGLSDQEIQVALESLFQQAQIKNLLPDLTQQADFKAEMLTGALGLIQEALQGGGQ